jgi:transcription elongation factor Elf1
MNDNISIFPVQICPKCGHTFTGIPALSREDNTTLICTDCGIREALASIGIGSEETEKILRIIHKYT